VPAFVTTQPLFSRMVLQYSSLYSAHYQTHLGSIPVAFVACLQPCGHRSVHDACSASARHRLKYRRSCCSSCSWLRKTQGGSMCALIHVDLGPQGRLALRLSGQLRKWFNRTRRTPQCWPCYRVRMPSSRWRKRTRVEKGHPWLRRLTVDVDAVDNRHFRSRLVNNHLARMSYSVLTTQSRLSVLYTGALPKDL
jgi:hypothetical protein